MDVVGAVESHHVVEGFVVVGVAGQAAKAIRKNVERVARIGHAVEIARFSSPVANHDGVPAWRDTIYGDRFALSVVVFSERVAGAVGNEGEIVEPSQSVVAGNRQEDVIVIERMGGEGLHAGPAIPGVLRPHQFHIGVGVAHKRGVAREGEKNAAIELQLGGFVGAEEEAHGGIVGWGEKPLHVVRFPGDEVGYPRAAGERDGIVGELAAIDSDRGLLGWQQLGQQGLEADGLPAAQLGVVGVDLGGIVGRDYPLPFEGDVGQGGDDDGFVRADGNHPIEGVKRCPHVGGANPVEYDVPLVIDFRPGTPALGDEVPPGP